MNDNEQALDAFGRIVVTEFDQTLDILTRKISRIENPATPADIAYKEYIEQGSSNDKLIFVAQGALEELLFKVFSIFYEYSMYKIVLVRDSGDCINLSEASELLPEETAIWIEKYSKYGSSTGARTERVLQLLKEERERPKNTK